ncbi:MAG: hypothetical protein CMB99_04840 [Flavobacteriaceae bacterium]|nr:hypothetical protein [Flavobacteriaceae bacterium]
MRKFLGFLFILLSFATFGQDLPSREIITPSNFLGFKNGDANIEGSTFLYEDWLANIVVFGADNRTYRYNNANYNLKERKFFVKLQNDSIYEINIKNLNYVVLNNKKFELVKGDYVERMAKGKINVFKQHALSIKEGMKDGTTKEKITPDRYVVKSAYVYLKNDALVPFKLKKKAIIGILELDDKKKFQSDIKKRKLSFKKEKDVIKIFEYYNSL